MNIRYIVSLLAAAAAGSAGAQQLNREIVIERDIVPRLEQATRHDPVMTMLKPQLTERHPGYSDDALTAHTVPLSAVLAPATGGEAVTTSRYRGYVDAGWPGVTAGYRIIDRSDLQLGIHAMYIHDQYSRDGIDMRDDAVTAGASLMWSPSQGNRLTAAVTYDWYNYARDYIADGTPAQYYQRPALNIGWESRTGAPVSYRLGAGVRIFAFGKDYKPGVISFDPEIPLGGVREDTYSFAGDIAYDASRVSRLGLEASADLMHYNDRYVCNRPHNLRHYSNNTRSVTSLTPYYRYADATRGLTARLGVNIGLTPGDGSSVQVAPDVNLAWNVSQRLGLTLDVTGGTDANSVSDIAAINPYAAQMLVYSHSHIPVDARLGLRVDPFAGASLTIYGGYARANDRLMPYNMRSDCFMIPVDIKGWHAGATLAYSYRDIIGATVSYEAASHGDDSGYYMWRDGAAGVLDASVTCTPVKPLQIQVGYNLRHGRRAMSMLPDGTDGWYRMSNTADLWAGAMYRIIEPLSAFVRVNNITGHRSELLPGLPARGLSFIAGAAFKF